MSQVYNINNMGMKERKEMLLNEGFSIKENLISEFICEVVGIAQKQTLKELEENKISITDIFNKKFTSLFNKYLKNEPSYSATIQLMSTAFKLDEVKEIYHQYYKREEDFIGVEEFKEIQRFLIAVVAFESCDFFYRQLLSRYYPQFFSKRTNLKIFKSQKNMEYMKKMILLKSEGKLSYQAREFVYSEILEKLQKLEDNKSICDEFKTQAHSFLFNQIVKVKGDPNLFFTEMERCIHAYLSK